MAREDLQYDLDPYWRQEKARKHPDDARNKAAADMLAELQDTVDDVTDEDLNTLDCLLEDPEMVERWQETVERIGFDHEYVDARTLVRDFIERATKSD